MTAVRSVEHSLPYWQVIAQSDFRFRPGDSLERRPFALPWEVSQQCPGNMGECLNCVHTLRSLEKPGQELSPDLSPNDVQLTTYLGQLRVQLLGRFNLIVLL